MVFEIINLSTAAFKGINLKIDKPGLYGVIGRNGVGKTTLFTQINHEMTVSSGQINFSGRVAYVPHLDIFDGNLCANDYLDLLKTAERKKAEALILAFQADRFFNKKIKTYSLGMKEILAFIYTVSLEADLIIIDELMNGMDHSLREVAFDILKKEAECKIILFTSHILEEVEKYCEKVYFLSPSDFSQVSDFEEAKKLISENEAFI